jgi:hypothetical protein
LTAATPGEGRPVLFNTGHFACFFAILFPHNSVLGGEFGARQFIDFQ